MKKTVFMLCILMVCICLTGCISSKESAVSFESAIAEEMEKDEKNLTDMNPNDIVNQQMQIAMENAEASDDITGERAEEEFQQIMDTYSGTEQDHTGESLGVIILKAFYGFYYTLRIYAAPICVISMLTGSILFFFAKGNKSLRKFGLFGLVCGVPSMLITLILLMGYLNDLFLY